MRLWAGLFRLRTRRSGALLWKR